MGKDNGENRKLRFFLVISIIISVILAMVYLYQFELNKTSPPTLPYIRHINTSSLNGNLSADTATGMPLTLNHTGHLTGEISANEPIYFFITYGFNGATLPALNTGNIKNTSTVFVGPDKGINVSTELPPGQWWLNIFAQNTGTIVNSNNFEMNYTPFPTAVYNTN